MAECKFNSIACFDLETTGLPQYDNNVKITEFAVLGVVRAHVKRSDVAENVSFTGLPRIVHKLSFCVYPNKFISLGASTTTGLYNDMLEPIQPWSKEKAEMIITFLNHLPSPVCLVAHNGNKFDFPILKRHLNMFQLMLPDHILCVDSLPGFRKILPELQAADTIQKMMEEMNSTCDDDELIKMMEEIETTANRECTRSNLICPLRQDQVTPERKHPGNNFPRITKKEIPNMRHPPHDSQVRRCLFPSGRRVSYKLGEVHKQLFGVLPDTSHTAEDDALTLLKCVLKTSPKFLEWADENCQPFSSIQ